MFAVLLLFGLTIANVASQECASNQFKISQNGQDYIVVDSVSNTVNVTGTLKTGQLFLNGVDIAATLASLTNAISALQTQMTSINQTQIQFAQQVIAVNTSVQSVSAQVNLINQTQIQHSHLISADQAAISSVNTTVQSVFAQVNSINQTQIQFSQQVLSVNTTVQSVSAQVGLINQTQVQHTQLINAEQAAISSVNATVQTVSSQVNLINQTQIQHSQLINLQQTAINSVNTTVQSVSIQVNSVNQTQIQHTQLINTVQTTVGTVNTTVQSVSAQVNLINQTQVQHSQLINADQAAINNVNTTVQTVSSQVSALSNNVTVIANQQSQQSSQLTAINATNFGSASWCLNLVNKAEIETYNMSAVPTILVRWAVGAENYDPTGVFSLNSGNNATISITKRGIVDLDLSFDFIPQPKSGAYPYVYTTIFFKTNVWHCLSRSDYASWDGLFCQRSFLANPGDTIIITISAQFISSIDTGPNWSRACLRFQPLY